VFVPLTLLIANALNIAKRKNASNTAPHAVVFSGIHPLKSVLQNEDQRVLIATSAFIAEA